MWPGKKTKSLHLLCLSQDFLYLLASEYIFPFFLQYTLVNIFKAGNQTVLFFFGEKYNKKGIFFGFCVLI